MKTCNRCGIEKDLDSFKNSKNNRGGKTPACKSCLNAYARANRAANPGQQRKYWVKHKYGVTDEASLGSSCRICGASEELHIDHCHTSGKVRGLLCRKCNLGLGHFRDNPVLLAAAIEYLNVRRG